MKNVLDEKTRIERFNSQSWESLKANPLYKDLIEFKDVRSESGCVSVKVAGHDVRRVAALVRRRVMVGANCTVVDVHAL